MVRIQFEFIRYQSQQALFDFDHILARCDAGTVGHPEDMGIHGDSRMAEGRVQHDIGRLAPDAGQGLQCGTVLRYLATMLFLQHGAGLDDVFCLGVIQANGFDVFPEAFFADGLAEDLITRLSTWRAFPVIARNSSFQFRGGDADLKHVSKALGARYNAGDRFCSD